MNTYPNKSHFYIFRKTQLFANTLSSFMPLHYGSQYYLTIRRPSENFQNIFDMISTDNHTPILEKQHVSSELSARKGLGKKLSMHRKQGTSAQFYRQVVRKCSKFQIAVSTIFRKNFSEYCSAHFKLRFLNRLNNL